MNNDTTLLALIVAAVVVIALLLGWAVLAAKARRFPYRLAGPLLSNAERAFHSALIQAVGNRHLVFVKVRIADVLTPRSDLGRSDWWRAFTSISSKHFDFVICDAQDWAVRLAIELDDASHREAARQQRDAFLNGACEAAGLPLLRVAAARSYAVAELRRRIDDAASTAPVTITHKSKI